MLDTHACEHLALLYWNRQCVSVCLFVCMGFCVVLGSSIDLWHWVGVRGRTKACVKPVVGQRIVTPSAYLIRTRPSGRKINSWVVCCSAFRKELLLEHNTIFTSLFTSYYTPLFLSLTSFQSLWSLSLSFTLFLFSVSNFGQNEDELYYLTVALCKVNRKSTRCVANAVSCFLLNLTSVCAAHAW